MSKGHNLWLKEYKIFHTKRISKSLYIQKQKNLLAKKGKEDYFITTKKKARGNEGQNKKYI